MFVSHAEGLMHATLAPDHAFGPGKAEPHHAAPKARLVGQSAYGVNALCAYTTAVSLDVG